MEGRVIRFEGVTKLYKVGTQIIKALDSVDLSISRDQFVAIMGPSGSGKSTLMNVMGCLDSLSAGRYLLNGTDVSKMDEEELADIRNREIGFVFQSFNLLPRYNALENVALPLIYSGVEKKEREERALEVLKRVGLELRVKHRPHELSGGERQRVAIARALVNTPSLILADEPTGNLDSKNSNEIMELFSQIHSMGNCVVIVTHEEEIAQKAHRVVKLRDGLIESDNYLK
ncbi:MAG: ABC transporter ATP-binding protein [Bacteroidales bacterium]